MTRNARYDLWAYAESRLLDNRQWNITEALLSHTPMTKEASKSVDKNVKDIQKSLDKAKGSLKRQKKKKVDLSTEIKSSYTVELEPGETLGPMLSGVGRGNVKRGKT